MTLFTEASDAMQLAAETIERQQTKISHLEEEVVRLRGLANHMGRALNSAVLNGVASMSWIRQEGGWQYIQEARRCLDEFVGNPPYHQSQAAKELV